MFIYLFLVGFSSAVYNSEKKIIKKHVYYLLLSWLTSDLLYLMCPQCWSSGRITHVPFYFLCAGVPSLGVNGSPLVPRLQSNATDFANQSLFTELTSWLTCSHYGTKDYTGCYGCFTVTMKPCYLLKDFEINWFELPVGTSPLVCYFFPP